MDNNEKNGNGGSIRNQWKKWGDNPKQKDTKATKASGVPSGVDYTGLTYTNGDFYCC